MSTEDQPDEHENPYASPASPQSSWQLGSSGAQDPEMRELRAFVGSNADYYLHKWAYMRRQKRGGAGSNITALFLSALWLPYRKMYKMTCIFIAFAVLVTILQEVLFVGILGEPQTPRMVARIVRFAIAAVCGYCGNGWYLSHAKKIIAEVRMLRLDEESFLNELTRRGGTNLLASLAVVCLFTMVTLVFVFGP